jgi:hypothetical protein
MCLEPVSQNRAARERETDDPVTYRCLFLRAGPGTNTPFARTRPGNSTGATVWVALVSLKNDKAAA